MSTTAGGNFFPEFQIGWRQRALMAARRIARFLANQFNANVNYDVAMYEALANLRAWSPRDVVFDVGANDGRTITRIVRHLPEPRIYAFEPASKTFESLSDLVAGCDNVEAYRLALGAETGKRTIYLNESSALNSLYPEWGRSHGTEQVDITTLDRFAEEHAVERIHLLKIDAEGHDLEILKGAERLLRESRIEIIQIEAGFSVPGAAQPPLNVIRAFLLNFDYYLYGIYNQCRNVLPDDIQKSPPSRPKTRHVLQFCDALFVPSRTTSVASIP